MGRRKNRNFTIIEIVLCLGLVSIIGGLIVFKTHGLIAYYRGKKAESEFYDELQLVHYLSVAHNAEIEVTLEVRGNELIFIRQTDDPIQNRYFKKNKRIAPITSLEVNGEPTTHFSATFLANSSQIPENLQSVKPIYK